jgi:hypothetical protein
MLVSFRGNYESNRPFRHPNRNGLLVTDLCTPGVYRSHLTKSEIMFWIPTKSPKQVALMVYGSYKSGWGDRVQRMGIAIYSPCFE